MKDLCNNCNCGNDCICDILESIALEDAAIAHILNAEGEKIQKALEDDLPFNQVLCVNKSVENVISEITNLEIVLVNKLKALANIPCIPSCPKPNRCLIVHVCNQNHHPIRYALVKICKGDKVVDSGGTNEKGLFKSCCLQNTCYDIIVCVMGAEKCKTVCFKECDCDKIEKICFEFC